jgi:hypothetical protein
MSHPDKALVDAFYRKLGGRTILLDVCAPNGSVVIPSGRRADKRAIARAIESGAAAAMLEMFILNPQRLGRYGNRKLRKELRTIARDDLSGEQHEAEIARILGANSPRSKVKQDA